MLLAVTKHPAMLHYLDNVQSIGPNSKAGQKGKRGLNENLARELLELHTLGVDGGYSQADVTSLARILTGWSVVGAKGTRGQPGTYVFFENGHEPGDQMLIGKLCPANGEAHADRKPPAQDRPSRLACTHRNRAMASASALKNS
jgi:uncharacterized protein (DUF1800 family)